VRRLVRALKKNLKTVHVQNEYVDFRIVLNYEDTGKVDKAFTDGKTIRRKNDTFFALNLKLEIEIC